MLLIFPPVFRPVEPPAGVARLSGFLKSRGIFCRVADLNYRFMSDALRSPALSPEQSPERGNAFSRRSLKNLPRNLELLRSPMGYANNARYGKASYELNHIIAAFADGRAEISLSDYAEPGKNPLKSEDLIAAFLNPEGSPLFPWFSQVLDGLLQDEAAFRGNGDETGKASREQSDGNTVPDVAGFSLCFLSQALPAF